MGFLDKVKEKVNKVVDVDKLGEMASKTLDSVKHEVAKAVDPNVKEQERLEQERIKKEKEEAARREKEEAIADFFASIELGKEIDYIFSVLEKSGVTASNFEKGVEHMLSKNEATVTKEDVLPTFKKELVARAFSKSQFAGAIKVTTDYFLRDIINYAMLMKYIPFAVSRKGGQTYSVAFAEKSEHPFIQVLYGVAGRAVHYQNTVLKNGIYSPMTADDFIGIIENSKVLKSYTDKDPFTADEVRAAWAPELCNSSLQLVTSSKWGDLLTEEQTDALYYFAYTLLCKTSCDVADVEAVVNVYFEHMEACYSKVGTH